MTAETDRARRDEDGGIRERILSAAISILREKGIQELSQVQVARRAEVRQSHLTYYFPKRYDLLEAVAVRVVDGIARSVREASARAAQDDGAAMLRHLADVITEPDHMRMFVGIVVVADANPECRVVLVRETLRMQAVLAEVLGGADAFERAGHVLAALWGLGVYRLAMGAPDDRMPMPPFLTDLLGTTKQRASGASG